MNIPNTLTAGDSVKWQDSDFVLNGVRYDSGAYSLSYELRGAAKLTVHAVPSARGWAASVSQADSGILTPGPYWWSAIVTAGDERLTVGTGQLLVSADLSTITDSYDGRSQAARALSDARAALANLTASGVKTKSYAIGTRKMEYYTATELIDAIRYWQGIVLNEDTTAGIANGLGNPRNLYVRFR